MRHKFGHIFIDWEIKYVCFTHAELQRLHLHFLHRTAERLLALIRRARPEEMGGI